MAIATVFEMMYMKRWSTRDFNTVIERLREDAHTSPDKNLSQLLDVRRQRTEDAFKRLHPRAYNNMLARRENERVKTVVNFNQEVKE